MILGYVDDYRQAKVKLTALGKIMDLEMDAIIDTGFDGDLCLPIQMAIELRLELRSTARVELADGSIKRELIFTGTIKFGNETRDVDVFLTDSNEALIGTNLLSKNGLNIDFPTKMVSIS